MNAAQRLSLIATAEAQLKKPYVWTAKGPDQFDCSGLVTYCMEQAGFTGWRLLFGPHEILGEGIKESNWRAFCNADRLYKNLVPVAVKDAKPGDLIFYGAPGHATHVMVNYGDGRIIGASGGNSSTLAPTKNACVKFKPKYDYRPDFLQFGQLP